MSVDTTQPAKSRRRPDQNLNSLVELAFLLTLVAPGTLLDTPSAPDTRHTLHDMVFWRRFVDAFAWLADFRKGGGSVTAICSVEISGLPVLLVTSNHGVKDEVSTHLRYLLKILQDLTHAETGDRVQVLENIVQSSVRVSRDKVQNYSNRLFKLVQRFLASSETSSVKSGMTV